MSVYADGLAPALDSRRGTTDTSQQADIDSKSVEGADMTAVRVESLERSRFAHPKRG